MCYIGSEIVSNTYLVLLARNPMFGILDFLMVRVGGIGDASTN